MWRYLALYTYDQARQKYPKDATLNRALARFVVKQGDDHEDDMEGNALGMQRREVGGGAGREEVEVAPDHLIVDQHELLHHHGRRLVDADVVVCALRHLRADDATAAVPDG